MPKKNIVYPAMSLSECKTSFNGIYNRMDPKSGWYEDMKALYMKINHPTDAPATHDELRDLLQPMLANMQGWGLGWSKTAPQLEGLLNSMPTSEEYKIFEDQRAQATKRALEQQQLRESKRLAQEQQRLQKMFEPVTENEWDDEDLSESTDTIDLDDELELQAAASKQEQSETEDEDPPVLEADNHFMAMAIPDIENQLPVQAIDSNPAHPVTVEITEETLSQRAHNLAQQLQLVTEEKDPFDDEQHNWTPRYHHDADGLGTVASGLNYLSGTCESFLSDDKEDLLKRIFGI